MKGHNNVIANNEQIKELEFRLKQSAEFVENADVELNNLAKENSKLKTILAEKDSELKQLIEILSRNKITEKSTLLAKDNEYSDLEQKYNKILSEYSSIKTEHNLLFKRNSSFLEEEKFFLIEMDRQKKNISQSDLHISKLETMLKEKDKSYNICKLILEQEREMHIHSSKNLNLEFNSLSTFYENQLSEKKIGYLELEKRLFEEIEFQKKKMSDEYLELEKRHFEEIEFQEKKMKDYVSLISTLRSGLDNEEKSHKICRNIIQVYQEERKSLENINFDHTSKYLPYFILFFLVFCYSQVYLFPVV